MKKTIALLLSVALMVGILAACSSDPGGVSVEASVVSNEPSDEASAEAADETSAEASKETAEVSEASDAASAAADGEQGETLKRVIENGKLVMLTNAAFPPYEYRTSDGQAAGVDVDLSQAIADQIGVELEVVDMEFDSLIPAMQSGKGDLVAAGLTVTDERKQSVDFSDTYADAKQMIIVPIEGAVVESEDDLPGKNIGVQLGTTGDLLVADIEGANVSQYKSGLEAAMDLKNGRIDAIVIDLLPAQNIVAQNSDSLMLVDMASTDEQYAIAIDKNNADFLEIINGVIAQMQADGAIEEATSKHVQASQAG